MTRKTVALAALTAALLTPALATGQMIDGPANIVQVENTTDQTLQSRARFSIARASASDTEAGNLAHAYSHDCTGCQSLAAAYQAVFVAGDNTNFSPQNAGVAVNANCSGCGSFAYAYQYVVTADRKPRFADGDRDKLDDLRGEASAALRGGLPYPEIDAKLKDIAVRFRALVDAAVTRADIHVDKRKSTERQDDHGSDS
jgi:hypothetical protein